MGSFIWRKNIVEEEVDGLNNWCNGNNLIVEKQDLKVTCLKQQRKRGNGQVRSRGL